jgi:CBS domain-containing protein
MTTSAAMSASAAAMERGGHMGLPYKPLPVRLAPPGTFLKQPGQTLPEQLTLAHPALDAMTDLAQVSAATIEPEAGLDKAEDHMRHAKVKLLFVTGESRDLLGIITLNDLKGERPVRFQRDMGVSHRDIRVSDIMTAVDRLETIPLEEVMDSRVGDVLQTLKRTGRQHALVIERGVAGYAIRGIFSATRMSRQLGIPVETSGIAYTFAELEAALTH